MASNGERVVADNMLPIPTTAKAATGKSSPAPNCCSTSANVAPMPAPRNKVGVNTPPTAPEPTVTSVATSLASTSPANTSSPVAAASRQWARDISPGYASSNNRQFSRTRSNP